MPRTKAAVAETARARKPLPSSREALIERFKDYPGITAFNRAYESPEGPGSLPILLIDEDANSCIDSFHQGQLRIGVPKCHLCGKPARLWYLRHVNTKQIGRVAAIRAKGLIPVRMEEVQRKDEIADLMADSADGLVHTGINGAKVLYKIPLDLYNARKREERRIREKRGKNTKQVRADIANDAAARPGFGSEAADAINDGLEYSERAFPTTLEAEAGSLGADDE